MTQTLTESFHALHDPDLRLQTACAKNAVLPRDTARAMSQENVEIVRQAYEAVNAFMRGELSSEAVAEHELLDPQFEWEWHDERKIPDVPQHLRGVPELIEFWTQYRSAWDDVVTEPLEFIDAPDGRVLVCVRESVRGRKSGGPIVVHFFQLFTIRDGKWRRVDFFRHRADALEAAGLRK